MVFQQYSGMLLASSIPEYCWNAAAIATGDDEVHRWYSSSTPECCLQAASPSTAGIPQRLPPEMTRFTGGIPAVLGNAACKQHPRVLLEYHHSNDCQYCLRQLLAPQQSERVTVCTGRQAWTRRSPPPPLEAGALSFPSPPC